MACSVEGCVKERQVTGLCRMHYSRKHRHGDVHHLGRASSEPGGAKEKKAFVDAYKIEHGCIDCGYNAHPAALDFDHLPGTVKVRDIKSGQQLGWAALRAEIAKCEVVCANCHRIRTVTRARDGKEVLSTP